MTDVSRLVCVFIYEKWVLKEKSQRAFAKKYTIDEGIVRKIKKTALGIISYDIPLSTIQNICYSKEISFSEFFKLVEDYAVSPNE